MSEEEKAKLWFEDPQIKEQVEYYISETAKLLGITFKEKKAFFPPPIDDMDAQWRMSWMAVLDLVAEEPEVSKAISGFRVGGRLAWPEKPKNSEIMMAVRRSVAFALTVGIAPERDFIYQALIARQWSHNSALLGLYIEDCVTIMRAAIANAKKPSDIPTAEATMKDITNKLQEASRKTLQDSRKIFQEQWDGTPRNIH